MKRLLSGLMVVGAALMLSATAMAADTGKTLGAFKLKNAEGKEVTEAALKGKRTLLVLAQTACSQCKRELKEVDANLDKLAAKGQVFVVLVDMNAAAGLEGYKLGGYKMSVLVDDKFELGADAGLDVTPATMIVDKDLKIVYSKTGYRPGDLEKILETF